MAQIALTIAPALTVALTLVASGSLVSLTAPPDAPAHTLTLASDVTVTALVGEVLRGPRGLKGDRGPAGPAAGYEHTQGVAASIWVVTHGLGKRPSVTVMDSAGDQVEGDVTYLDLNSLTIEFSAPFSGQAFLN